MESTDAQSLQPVVIDAMGQQQSHHQQCGSQQDSQVRADLAIVGDGQNRAAAQHHKVAHKADARQGHEHDGDPLDRG
jgi:hypothetical protein